MNVYCSLRFTPPSFSASGFNPIMLGMVADNGETFYAEFNDYDKKVISLYAASNIISKMKFEDDHFVRNNHKINGDDSFSMEVRGDRNTVSENASLWLSQFRPEKTQLVIDKSPFEGAVLMTLFGGGLYLPDNVNDCVFSVNQMMGVSVSRSRFNGAVPLASLMDAAYDWDRQELADMIDTKDDIGFDDYLSLHDAQIVRTVYLSMANLYFAPSKIVDYEKGDEDDEKKTDD